MNRITAALVGCLVSTPFVNGALAEAGAATDERSTLETVKHVTDNEYYKIHLNMRMRIELAKGDNLTRSEAPTLRTRLGLETKPFRGFSALAEMENIAAFCSSCYFDAVEPPTGQTTIADPTTTQLNRGFLRYRNEGDTPLLAVVGRQRIIYDDARFIGNVGWRQNEQTFDSVYAETSVGVPGFNARYGYLWDVHRVFGDEDGDPTRSDFDSNSHSANVSYERGGSWPRVAAFAYLLDLENRAPSSMVNSSNSYGLRLTGSYPPVAGTNGEGKEAAGNWELDYEFSYAVQTDAANNPLNYDAHYVWVSLLTRYAPVGSLKLGFEMLGSDDGIARFVTPLATAHKFNGYADIFLDNGGPNGLKDIFLTAKPSLPWGLRAHLTYHHFWSDETGDSLGNEIDGVLSKKLGYGFSVLTKGAYFDSTAAGRAQGRQSTWRWWLDLTYEY